MSDDPNLPGSLVELVSRPGLVTLLALSGWGAAGGATNALATRSGLREGLRLILLGAIVAAGTGSVAGGLLVHYFPGLSLAAVPATSLVSVGAYMAGTFGGAVVELVLRRLRAGRLPGEGPTDG